MPSRFKKCSACNDLRWVRTGNGKSVKCGCLIEYEYFERLDKSGLSAEDNSLSLDIFPSHAAAYQEVNRIVTEVCAGFKEGKLPLTVLCFASAAHRDRAENYIRFVLKEALKDGISAHFGPLDRIWEIFVHRVYREEGKTWEDSVQIVQGCQLEAINIGLELLRKDSVQNGNTIIQAMDHRKQAMRCSILALPYVSDDAIRDHYGLDFLQYVHNPRKCAFLNLDDDSANFNFKLITTPI